VKVTRAPDSRHRRPRPWPTRETHHEKKHAVDGAGEPAGAEPGGGRSAEGRGGADRYLVGPATQWPGRVNASAERRCGRARAQFRALAEELRTSDTDVLRGTGRHGER